MSLKAINLEDAAAFDLVAVLAGLELLVVGLVLGGHEVLSHPATRKNWGNLDFCLLACCCCCRLEFGFDKCLLRNPCHMSPSLC